MINYHVMDKKEMEEQKNKWIERLKKEGKITDVEKLRKSGLFAIQNPVRRKIIEVIGKSDKITVDNLSKGLNLDKNQVKFHLGMLETALFVEKKDEDTYTLTPRGVAYVTNADWEIY